MLAAAMMYWFDKWIIDYCIVNGVGYLSLVASRCWGWVDRNIVDGLVNVVGEGTKIMGRTLRYLQTGVVEQYIFLLAAALLLICIVVLIGHYSEVAWIPIAGFYR